MLAQPQVGLQQLLTTKELEKLNRTRLAQIVTNTDRSTTLTFNNCLVNTGSWAKQGKLSQQRQVGQ